MKDEKDLLVKLLPFKYTAYSEKQNSKQTLKETGKCVIFILR